MDWFKESPPLDPNVRSGTGRAPASARSDVKPMKPLSRMGCGPGGCEVAMIPVCANPFNVPTPRMYFDLHNLVSDEVVYQSVFPEAGVFTK